MLLKPNGKRLAKITKLIEAGDLKLKIPKEFVLKNAKSAQKLVEGGQVTGKVVLKID